MGRDASAVFPESTILSPQPKVALVTDPASEPPGDIVPHTPIPPNDEKAQERLREREARYLTLFTAVDDAVLLGEVIPDARGRAADFRHLEVNPSYTRLTGRTPDQVIGKTATDVLGENAASWIAAGGRAGVEGRPIRIEDYIIGPGKWLSVRFSPVGERGSGRFAAILSDITLRKQSEATLLEAAVYASFRADLEDALRPLTDPVAIQGAATRLIAERLRAGRAHYAEMETDGEHALVAREYVHGEAGGPARYRISDVPTVFQECRAGRTFVLDAAGTDPRLGSREKGILASLSIAAIVVVPLIKEQALIAVLAVEHATPHLWTPEDVALVEETAERTWDAVERARAESALLLSEERFRTMTDSVPQMIWTNLTSGEVNYLNQRWCDYSGLSRDECVGNDWQRVLHPDDIAVTRERWRRALATGTTFESEYRLRRWDGVYRWHIGRCVPLHNPGDTAAGEVVGWFGSATDIEDQKRAEDTLRASEEAVRQANESLERRVEERTRELAHMNEMRLELLRQLVTVQEEERGRISRDLHDDTGQQVTALLLGLSHLQHHPALAADTDVQETVTRLQMHAGEVAKKSHRLSFTLRPTDLDDIGLIGALANYAQEWSGWSGVPVDLQTIGFKTDGREPDRLPPEIETTIYRVTQEALTNVLRHAVPAPVASGPGNQTGASRVCIIVQRRASQVIATIEDDGPGFDVDAALNLPPGKRRLGIFGMQERARLAGGTLTIESLPGTATTVFLRLPLT
ncbi:MAG: PAS domain S-box protein [Armatimonadota bacterium]